MTESVCEFATACLVFCLIHVPMKVTIVAFVCMLFYINYFDVSKFYSIGQSTVTKLFYR
jgi:hypothetical protein